MQRRTHTHTSIHIHTHTHTETLKRAKRDAQTPTRTNTQRENRENTRGRQQTLPVSTQHSAWAVNIQQQRTTKYRILCAEMDRAANTAAHGCTHSGGPNAAPKRHCPCRCGQHFRVPAIHLHRGSTTAAARRRCTPDITRNGSRQVHTHIRGCSGFRRHSVGMVTPRRPTRRP